MANPAVNPAVVKLGRRGGSRWSSSDIWDQNANIWAVMRNSSRPQTLLPERRRSSFRLLKMSDPPPPLWILL